jgi:hypothetical protein
MKKTVEKGDIPLKKKNVFRSDAEQTANLIKVGQKGVENAIRASKALGLSIVYMENGILYKEHPDGTKTVIEESDQKPVSKLKLKTKVKKGTVLHAIQ